MPIIVTVVVFVAACYALGLAVGVVVAPVVAVAMVAGALAESSRRERGRAEARARAEREREEAKEKARAVPPRRPDGRARLMCCGWSYDLFEVEGRPGAVLAVLEPYTDHSVGYLFEDGPSTDGNPLGVECVGVYPHPSREFPGDALWMCRPEAGVGEFSEPWGEMTTRVELAMTHEICDNYGCKPVEGAPGGRGRRR